MIVMGLYLVIWGKSKDESQPTSKCDPDELPPLDHQHIPMTVNSTRFEKHNNDSVLIAIAPTDETVKKTNGI